MPRKFTLYWSSFEMYRKCPQKFLWTKGWGNVDPKPIPVKKSEHHAFMGIVIQAVIERLYNDQLWKDKTTYKQRLQELLEQKFRFHLGQSYIDWNHAPTQEEMFRVCYDGVFGYIPTMVHHKLIGQYARSEVDIVAYLDKKIPIGSRIDFLFHRRGDIMILDGKNSKYKGKYLNQDQLRWYALCYYVYHGKLPTHLGYIYWRFPYGFVPEGSDQPEEGVEWVPVVKDELRALAQEAREVRRAMDEEKFPANPVPSECKWCDYESICPDRQEQRKANAGKRSKKEKDEVPDFVLSGQAFGFGGEKGT